MLSFKLLSKMLCQQQIQSIAAQAVVPFNVQHFKLIRQPLAAAACLAVRAVLDKCCFCAAAAHVVQDHLQMMLEKAVRH